MKVQIVDLHTSEIIAKQAGKTMLTEVEISAEGSLLIQMVKDTTEAVPSRLRFSIDGYKAGALALTRLPVHGERTKANGPVTVRSSNTNAQRVDLAAKRLLAKTSMQSSTETTIPSPTTPVTRWFPSSD